MRVVSIIAAIPDLRYFYIVKTGINPHRMAYK
jgi:hypothetical protein